MILTITQASKSNPFPIQHFPTHFRLPPTMDCAGGSSSPAHSSIHGRGRKESSVVVLHQGSGRWFVAAARIHRR
jgi:hypothetical protein